ncbi:MAG: hypothetical protein Q7S26_02865 [bacterium]|nr:hypothetical protein [bacterium]
MKVRRYLPSAQFTLIVVSVAASAGLVYAADFVTKAAATMPPVTAVGTQPPNALANQQNWEATLYSIQAGQAESNLLPETPDQNTVDALRQAAQTDNVTESVGRTLLVNLTNAKTQGLGDDIPTQNQLIQAASAQIGVATPSRTYAQRDLATVADSNAASHAYGNALASVFAKNSHNNYGETLIAVDQATTQGDASILKKLDTIEANYRVLVADLLQVPVPKTLAPFHMALINEFTQTADTYPGIQNALSDPLRGLTTLQTYKSLGERELQMLINIAQAFDKNGILFKTDEPGALWGLLLSAQQL